MSLSWPLSGAHLDVAPRETAEFSPGEDPEFCHTLLDLSPDAIIAHREGEIIYANEAGVRLIAGAAPVQSLVGRSILELVPPEGREVAAARIATITQSHSGAQHYEQNVLRLDGKVITLEVAARPFTHEGRSAILITGRDISGRKQKEAQLRDSQQGLAEAQRLTRMGSWELDLGDATQAEGTSLRWSDEIFRIFGYETGALEVSHENFYQSIHPDDRDRVIAAIEGGIASGEPFTLDHRIILPNGAVRLVHVVSVVQRDEQGRPRKMHGIVQDITERQHVEEALRESQAKWRALAENAPDAIMTVDRDGLILFCNRTARALSRAVIGTRFCQHALPEYHTLMTQTLTRVFESGEPESFECDGARTNGQRVCYSCRMGAIRNGEEIVAAAVILTDITVRKEAEADVRAWKNRYDSVLHASGQIIYDWIPDADAITYGGSIEKLLGWTADDLTGGLARWVQLVHPEDREEFVAERQKILLTKSDFHSEYRLQRHTGEYITVEDSGYPVQDHAGGLSHVVGFIADISKQRQLENQLRHSQKMEAFGRLAGGVAHDFNNLLTVISGYSDIVLQDFSTSDPRRECVEEISKAAQRASALTAQLLAFSRQQVLQPRIIDVNTVLADTAKMLRRLIGEDVNLRVEPGEQVGCIKADLSQLENVLVNMAVNARDAMPEGGTITIRTRDVVVAEDHPEVTRGLAAGKHVLLTVQDTGVGMSDSVKDRIFEPFFTTKAVGHGTGLGLATCYGIVKQSGGHIEVQSQLGRGTTFLIYLPRVEDTAEEAAAREELTGLPGGDETVLLVEDEPSVRRLGCSILRSLGYNVLEACNGEEAFLTLQTRSDLSVSLVVTDLVMPEMGGKDLAYWIRASQPQARILFTSGYPNQATDDASLVGEGTDFLPKPYAPKVFAEKVRDLLDAAPVGAALAG